jgi:hypothetical protein
MHGLLEYDLLSHQKDIVKAPEIVDLGYRAARQAIEEWQRNAPEKKNRA